MHGIDESKVAEIAEGLNRSKQVDDPSLANLQGHFERIREVMAGRPGGDAIAYHQGSEVGWTPELRQPVKHPIAVR